MHRSNVSSSPAARRTERITMKETAISYPAKDRSPLFIAGVYVLVSILWIVFSDMAVEAMAGNSAEMLSLLQTIKGGFFVASTGIMLYLLVRSRVYKLRAGEKRYRSLFEAAGDGVLLLAENGFIDCNQQALALLGYSEVPEIIGKHPAELSPEVQPDGRDSQVSAQEKIARAKAGNPLIFEWRHKTLQGNPVDVSVSLSLADAEAGILVAIFRDMSELKRVQEQLQQSRKMQAIGRLAGGIAHDFNNILGGIIGYADMALDDVDGNQDLAHCLKSILKAGERAKNLVAQILTFSRQGQEEKYPLHLRPIIKEALALLRASLPSSITIDSRIEKDTAPVNADSTKVHEAFMNLVTNAAHAINEKGRISIVLEEHNITQRQEAIIKPLKPGFYSLIEVKDCGTGIDKELIPRIFEPFFTTREHGRGTGLGLSVVFGVMQSHNGNIQVESTPGEGTTIRLFFPKTTGSPADERDLRSTPPTGTERILLVDDEEALLELGKEMLTSLGYTITPLSSSKDALNILRNGAREYDLLITDQTMPELTGVELAQEVLKINPEFPIIICSGFSSKVDKVTARELGCRGYIAKPWTKRTLAQMVRSVLNESSPGT
ncbi:MAG: response regulator [Chitinivibrionales bacterium]|nr:response regulator [Chitinivibrionales bacterium]